MSPLKIISIVMLLPTLCCAAGEPAQTMEATVIANDYGHDFAPVWAAVEPASGVGGPVCVSGESSETPAQLERLPDSATRLWWVATLSPASRSRFLVEFGRDCSDDAFSWRPAGESATNLLFGDRPVLQYVHPVYDRNDVDGTRRPFHHVYDPSGRRHITKGAGGLYSHHRGIFYGYNQILVGDDDERIDIWHSNDGERQQHEEVLAVQEGPVFGGHSVRISWIDANDEPFAEEIREVRAFLQPAGRILIDFRSTLRSLNGPIRLDGDRQHAGVQFRAAQDVAENAEATRFLRPEPWAHLQQDQEFNDDLHVDLPWNVMLFSLDRNSYAVAYMSHPSNPSGAEMSERRYGRFGEFFRHDLEPGGALEARYRFWVLEDAAPTREEVERIFQDFARPPDARLD